MTLLNGVLPVDKPAGPTSHDVVAHARRVLRVRRIGHTGTLDPFASGLLLLCIGSSTRLAEYLTALPKSYTATLRLGVVTDSDDNEGQVLRTDEGWERLDRRDIEAALQEQRGEILQVPPRYSAKKVDGTRMYELARRGEEVRVPPVRVEVSRLALIRFDPPEVEIEVDCSSGTYIRAIARDVGEHLGVGAHLTQLRRVRIGSFDIESALTLDDLDDAAAVSAAIVPPARAVRHLQRIVLTSEEAREIAHGGSVNIPDVPRRFDAGAGPVALLDESGKLLAIGEHRHGRIQPRKVFS